VAQSDQPVPGGPANEDVVDAVLESISKSLVPRGYLTTEWWTTITGGALSAVLALVHVGGSTATHVAAVVAPTVLAALYAITRTIHKSALASVLGDVFPQAVGGAGAATAGAPAAPPGVQTTPAVAADQVTATPVAQTAPDFFFEGIPPIEDGNA
jgi:hypothetical protein